MSNNPGDAASARSLHPADEEAGLVIAPSPTNSSHPGQPTVKARGNSVTKESVSATDPPEPDASEYDASSRPVSMSHLSTAVFCAGMGTLVSWAHLTMGSEIPTDWEEGKRYAARVLAVGMFYRLAVYHAKQSGLFTRNRTFQTDEEMMLPSNNGPATSQGGSLGQYDSLEITTPIRTDQQPHPHVRYDKKKQ
ncbi:hypothetical protein M231_01183 [Tremella mesenterica]|uniref:Uncharacterized protein n=1 Tax=Tremella mesenterica TaxID=5217 RepID=A0A4Q1BTW1_TREME|nr:hypothetical protein M231_01183 [Tremella mesenterica]